MNLDAETELWREAFALVEDVLTACNARPGPYARALAEADVYERLERLHRKWARPSVREELRDLLQRNHRR